MGDSLNEYFKNISEFTSMSYHLNTDDFDEFEVWFEKLYKKDKRALFFLLKENKNMISKDKISYASAVFGKEI